MSATQKQLPNNLPGILGAALLLTSTLGLAQSECPQRFHTIPLTEDATFCQQFDDKLPASLSYHTSTTPQAALDYYVEQFSRAQHSSSKGRQVLQAPQGEWVVVISADGKGSQVDILVKKRGEE